MGKYTLMALVLVSGLAATPAFSAEVTFAWTATVNTYGVFDPYFVLDVADGDEIYGTFSVDDTDYTDGEYPGCRLYSITSDTTTIGNWVSSKFPPPDSFVRICDDALGFWRDTFEVFAQPYGGVPGTSVVVIEGSGNFVDGLDPVAPDISQANLAYAWHQLVETLFIPYAEVWATPTSLVCTSCALSLAEQLEELASKIVEINLQAGISNSLDTKLDTALAALDDTNENNDGAALNSMYAFCNSVEAQRGRKLTEPQADELIEAANGVIAAIDEYAPLCE